MKRLALTLIIVVPAFLGGVRAEAPVSYDLVYVRAPRAGDARFVPLPEIKDPTQAVAGSDLILLHPDGSEEVLVPGGNGAIADPYVSFDGEWIYYSKFHDLRRDQMNDQRRASASRAGADIFKINLKTRKTTQLTFQEWTPNTGAADWARSPLGGGAGEYYLGYGIFNLGPCPLPGGRVMFSSSRNGFAPNKGYTFPNLQLYVMDDDGKNVELIGHLNLGSALHPTILKDGRVIFSSYEAQGYRDMRLWALWSIWPDGRHWAPAMSAFTDTVGFHFQTQLSNGDIGVIEYYNQNNNGFGTLLAFPPNAPADKPPFGKAVPSDPSNPPILRGLWWFQPGQPSHLKPRYTNYPFSPYGLHSLTTFAHGNDDASSHALDGTWAGKVTNPSGAPNNDVLIVWTPGPANDLDRPTPLPYYDAGIYVIPKGEPVNDYRKLVLVKNSPEFNEIQPRAVVPYKAIYGIDEPVNLPWLPNDGSESPQLPAGTPFGMVGTSSFYKRDSKPGVGNAKFDGLDAFNTTTNEDSSNWATQGADAGRYANSDIYAVRILALEPSSHRSYGPAEGNGYRNFANERTRILGEIPLRKTDAAGNVIKDVDGNPDTSFLAKIPADVPFTFQTIDKDGLALNTSQTWHQVRPGEIRNDCGGCHAHSQLPTDFKTTAAAKPDYLVADLTRGTPLLSKSADGKTIVKLNPKVLDVEYYRDIKPVLQRSCVPCHSGSGRQEAKLVLDDTSVVNGYENTYNRLADDQAAKYGIPSVIASHIWRQTNASRYVRMFQSRRSLLVWKLFGRRLDGWTNADFPTESVPGDPKTLPPGAIANQADLDFTGQMCPTPGSNVPPLSEDEKMMFARWIDIGAPISSPAKEFAGRGWFQDDLRPTLAISIPRAGRNAGPLEMLRIGAVDYYSGLDPKSFSIKASMPINGKSAGSELASFFKETGDHIWTLPLLAPLAKVPTATLTVSVKDLRGNITKMERRFSVEPAPAEFVPPPVVDFFRSLFGLPKQ